MRLGVLGLGAISPYFLRAIEADPELELTGVCDLDPRKLAPFAERGTACFTDFTELLDAGKADAVVVTLPNDVHTPAVLAALARGVPVCCEKPLTVAAAEAEVMEATARTTGTTLFTAFHRRYNTNLRALTGHLPRDRRDIVRVTARYHENIAEHTGGEQWYLDPERCGGGCLIDNGPNALDAVRHLVGPLTLRDATLGDVRGGAEFYATLSLDADGIPVDVELDWALETGEVKDVVVELRDGRTLAADLLAGYDGFKSSLDHEYVGILAEFRQAVAAGPDWRDPGPGLVRLVEEAYRVGRAKEPRLRMAAKEPVSARVVKLLFHTRDDRGMRLSPWASRCVAAGEVHELVTTVDRPRDPGDEVNRVGFLGFAEFSAATVLQRGDEVYAGDRRLGTVSGFDECHAPNHYNILIATDRVLGAADIDLRVGDHIRFAEAPQ
ncbi:Gfo/Idh/MocA family protein [Streptomyces sp. G45]|uniref:Gfo/Idh/MocA family protein n=1 Tax=Streptomyces sp. G45 TaxID=3406627 RepID=UPI003C2421CF